MPCGCRMSWPIKKKALHVDRKVMKFLENPIVARPIT
jgi:hypothetical protein